MEPSKLQNGDTVGSVTVISTDKGIADHSVKQLWEGEQNVLNTNTTHAGSVGAGRTPHRTR